MIQRSKSLSLKEKLAIRVLGQDPSIDDILIIEEELEGSSLQLEAEEVHWKMGIEIEDFIWLTGFTSLAERIWEKGKKEGLVGKLSPEDFWEITNYTDSQKVRKESAKKGLKKAKNELKKIKKILKINSGNEMAQGRLLELDEIIKELKELVR